MSKVLLIKNAGLEGPGTVGELFESDGFELEIVSAKKEKIPELDHSAVLILGAPQSANDDLSYLKNEMNLIRGAAQKNIPTLGICLGSQLMAKALGARVYAGPKKEIGFYHDVRIDPASKSRLFEGIANPFTVFHWHGDTFEIPKNAMRLAYSEMYDQAFQYGSAVGVQFHFEVTKEIVLSWLDNTKEDLNLPYIDPAKIRNQIDSNIEIVQSNMKIFYRNFKSEFSL
ncbi:MAG TPA: type 1 glutamine amidotransferase [Candidatus Nitrosotenuis sp.]|nr:type 1 glutamine amidotransferase [Candidatus Nitrosotenuis sp.]